MLRQRLAAVRTRVVWNSMHPLPELPVWPTDDAPSVLRGGEISAKTVFDAVKAGDKVAIEIAEQFGEYLGKGLAVVANVVDPQIFVIGGGVSKAGDILFKYIEPSYKKCAFGPCKQAKFALATLGNDAGIYGAAALVLK